MKFLASASLLVSLWAFVRLDDVLSSVLSVATAYVSYCVLYYSSGREQWG